MVARGAGRGGQRIGAKPGPDRPSTAVPPALRRSERGATLLLPCDSSNLSRFEPALHDSHGRLPRSPWASSPDTGKPPWTWNQRLLPLPPGRWRSAPPRVPLPHRGDLRKTPRAPHGNPWPSPPEPAPSSAWWVRERTSSSKHLEWPWPRMAWLTRREGGKHH
jgi:hypothetical protein